MAPLIAQSPSITAQHSYINKISDLLPNFDYFQVEQSVNALRIQDRQKHQGQIAQAVSNLVTLPMPKSLTAIAKTESHLMHRLLHHDYLLNEFRHRDDFYFDTSTLELLYQRLKQQGHITSYDLSEMSEEVNRA
ncbi:DNA primase, partial [Streptococcus dysgalactiae]